jgi:hypothetical protein
VGRRDLVGRPGDAPVHRPLSSLHASVQRAHPPTLASPAFADTLTGLLTPFAQLHAWFAAGGGAYDKVSDQRGPARLEPLPAACRRHIEQQAAGHHLGQGVDAQPERLPAHQETMIHWAMTITMTWRLARRRPAVQPG